MLVIYHFKEIYNLTDIVCTSNWNRDSIEVDAPILTLTVDMFEWNLCESLIVSKLDNNYWNTLFKTENKHVSLSAHLCCHRCACKLKPKEVTMCRQMAFHLTENAALQAVWKRLAESNRKEIKNLYARLIAQAARAEFRAEIKEKGSNNADQ